MTLPQSKKTARLAGAQYLALAITGAFGIMYIPTFMLVTSDPAATAKNILENEGLFRLSIFSQLSSQTIFVFLVFTLYRLFQDVDLKDARLMVGLVLVSVPIAMLNTLTQIIALRLLHGEPFLAVYDSSQLQAQAVLFLMLSNDGVAIAQIFWGLWLFPFGLLVIKSGFIAKWIGYFLIAACIGYVANSTAHFLFPTYVALVAPFTAVTAAVAELSMVIWFLVIGVRESDEVPSVPG